MNSKEMSLLPEGGGASWTNGYKITKPKELESVVIGKFGCSKGIQILLADLSSIWSYAPDPKDVKEHLKANLENVLDRKRETEVNESLVQSIETYENADFLLLDPGVSRFHFAVDTANSEQREATVDDIIQNFRNGARFILEELLSDIEPEGLNEPTEDIVECSAG